MPTIAQRTIQGGTALEPVEGTGSRPGLPSQALIGAPVENPGLRSGMVISRGSLPGMIPGQSQLRFQQQSGNLQVGYVWPQIPISPVAQRVATNATPQPVPEPQGQTGQPRNVISCSASSEPYKTTAGNVVCAVSVSFEPYPYDPNFSNARIWFTGYHGSSTPQLMAQGPTSPVSFLADPTGETVTVYVEAISNQGQTSPGPVTSYAPSGTVTLSSAVGVPPTPSLAQTLRGTPTGYQFAFNQLSGLAANVIDGYGIYRNTTNTTGTAVQIQYVKQNPANATPIVISDTATQGQVYYYWVAAFDTSGNESAWLAAQSGAIATQSTFDAASGKVTTFVGQGTLSTVNQANTVNIVAGAVNSNVNYSSAILVNCPANTTTTVASTTITTNGGYVKISVAAQMFNQGPGTASPTIYLYKGDSGGTPIQFYGRLALPAAGNGGGRVFVMQGLDDSPSASQTYTLVCKTSSSALQFDSVNFTVENAKV